MKFSAKEFPLDSLNLIVNAYKHSKKKMFILIVFLFFFLIPFFWLSRFLSGATLFVIGSHAAFRELESSDIEELLMEPVWASGLSAQQVQVDDQSSL